MKVLLFWKSNTHNLKNTSNIYTKSCLHHQPFEILSSTIDIYIAESAAKARPQNGQVSTKCNVKHKPTARQSIAETCFEPLQMHLLTEKSHVARTTTAAFHSLHRLK